MTPGLEWYRAVHKHQHQGAPDGVYCSRPWSALCQSEHYATDGDSWTCTGRVCYGSDHETHAEAMAALEAHIRADECDPLRDLTSQPCTGAMPAETEVRP